LSRYGARRSARAFVDRIVAIVVDAIACLGHWHRGGSTRNRAIATRRRPEGTSAELTRHAGLTAAGITLVGHAIAIVILAVATLGLRHHIRHALERAHRTIERPGRTNPGQHRRAYNAPARIPFVGYTITIVVDAVARFILLRHSRHARLRQAAGTHGHGDHTPARAARQSAEAVVDEQVAIVIDVIARFWLGLSRRTRLRYAIDTRFDRCETRAPTTRRCGDVFIIHAVAIVIHSVAFFGRRQYFVLARPPRHVDTRLRASLARADIHGAITTGITGPHFAFDGARTIDPIVDFAIAVFVRAITGFGCGHAWHTLRNHSRETTIDHDRTSALAARHRWEVFVRLAIAIVVRAIARFSAR
jgi:hypothetical protein